MHINPLMAIVKASERSCSIVLERPGVTPLEALEALEGRGGLVWSPAEWGCTASKAHRCSDGEPATERRAAA